MLYNVLLVSAVPQSESAICIHISPPLLDLPSTHYPSHSSPSSQSRVEFPVLYSRFPLAIYFKQGSVFMSNLISQFIPPSSLTPHLATYPLCMSVSLFLPCKQTHLYHLSRLHTYVLTYYICFSLSDLLHSV